MPRIPAAENLTIEIDAPYWRLLSVNGSAADERRLFEAAANAPLRYDTGFAYRRRLDSGGTLPTGQVQRVVLGWSETDGAWHLGLLLTPELAARRGSRWLELAHWQDAHAGTSGGAATQAAEALAHTLALPYALIPPRGTSTPDGAATAVSMGASPTAAGAHAAPTRMNEPAYATRPIPVDVVLPLLPVKTGLWTLDAQDGALVYRRSRLWIARQMWRAAWYAVGCVVYIALSLATLNSTLALPNAGTMLPNPEVLPYLGLGSALLLFGMCLYVLIDTALSPDVLRAENGSITLLRGDQPVWSESSATGVQVVYVTQVVGRKRGRGVLYHAELNLHFGGQRFKRLIRLEALEEPLPAEVPADALAESVLPLADAQTPMQAAALHLARALGVACVYDQRTR